MADGRRKILLAWSSGKDSAWCLELLRRRSDVVVAGLLTTVNEAEGRVAVHGARSELLEAQARAIGLTLHTVPLPHPCPNEAYEAALRQALERARGDGVTAVAFGDLFLEEIRDYRERILAGTGVEPLFPIWGLDTGRLAAEMWETGLRSRIICLDPARLAPSFAGRDLEPELLATLPAGVDPCGENGEFHTFVWDGPMFARPLAVANGETVARDGFLFSDLGLAGREA